MTLCDTLLERASNRLLHHLRIGTSDSIVNFYNGNVALEKPIVQCIRIHIQEPKSTPDAAGPAPDNIRLALTDFSPADTSHAHFSPSMHAGTVWDTRAALCFGHTRAGLSSHDQGSHLRKLWWHCGIIKMSGLSMPFNPAR